VIAFREAVLRSIAEIRQTGTHVTRIKKGARSALIDSLFKQRVGLLDFGFFELDMLAHDGVIFAERHFFRDVARIFLGHVEEARVSGAEQLDLDRGWLRHGPFLLFK
jgi:hypothetical protein